ncbi:MAG TPA: PQQ-binding-like beta-propeller repeat protein [Verrucomicrobiae bacterium]|nr:PQQ-binding-like beta-propeller repeat protein [Verrucomicrobiae bacterium]
MEQNLYIGSNGHVAAINAQTGEELWRKKLKEGLFSATHYEDVSVIVRDGIIYAGCSGHLFALSPAGEVLWHNPLKGLGHNDLSLAFEGQSIQYLQKTVHQQSSSSSS